MLAFLTIMMRNTSKVRQYIEEPEQDRVNAEALLAHVQEQPREDTRGCEPKNMHERRVHK